MVHEYVAITIRGVTGYFDTLFAKDIYTERLCVKKSDGTNVCIDGDQVESVLNADAIPQLQNNPTVSGTSILEEENNTQEGESSSSDESATTTLQNDEIGSDEVEDLPVTHESESDSGVVQMEVLTPPIVVE